MNYLEKKPNYVLNPTTRIKGFDNQAFEGYQAILNEISNKISGERTVITIDCYLGVDKEELIKVFSHHFEPTLVIDSNEMFYSSEKIEELLEHNITDDRVFGVAYFGQWLNLVDQKKMASLKEKISQQEEGVILVIGTAADYLCEADILLLADLPTWEIQQRYRSGLANFGADNAEEEAIRKFKRGYFIDWRLGNNHKQTLYTKMDYYLDTTTKETPKMITRKAFEEGLLQLLEQPFRTVPYFDEGLWGGQWMKEVCDIEDKSKSNYAWSVNLMFQENEVNLTYGNIHLNVPGYTLTHRYPKELIGERGFARFGAEYPIRLYFLDTMEGGNLSLQVHPNQQYMYERFGMPESQNESYYFLDSSKEEETYIYLGFKNELDKEGFVKDLRKAEAGEIDFPAEKYVNKIPIKNHEHYSIPAGTIHCSGKDTMVLEISSCTSIFTLKLWDWGRVGLDGLPRPIHVEEGLENLDFTKDYDWIKENCAYEPVLIEENEVFKKEKTGLSKLHYMETERITMTGKTLFKTNGETNALNLVVGREALIESPTNQFAPFVVHFSESICIPALISEYTISPYGESADEEIAVVNTFITFP